MNFPSLFLFFQTFTCSSQTAHSQLAMHDADGMGNRPPRRMRPGQAYEPTPAEEAQAAIQLAQRQAAEAIARAEQAEAQLALAHQTNASMVLSMTLAASASLQSSSEEASSPAQQQPPTEQSGPSASAHTLPPAPSALPPSQMISPDGVRRRRVSIPTRQRPLLSHDSQTSRPFAGHGHLTHFWEPASRTGRASRPRRPLGVAGTEMSDHVRSAYSSIQDIHGCILSNSAQKYEVACM